MRGYFKKHLLPLVRRNTTAQLSSLGDESGAAETKSVTIRKESPEGSYSVVVPSHVRKPGYSVSISKLNGTMVYGVRNVHSESLNLDLKQIGTGVYMLEILSGDELLSRDFLRN